MCGRFSIHAVLPEILARFNAVNSGYEWMPRYNCSPGQFLPIIVESESGNNQFEFVLAKWGLIPSWAKSDFKANLFNARSESLLEKNSFRSSFKHRRCLVPADSFFEWKTVGNEKFPFRFFLKKQKIFAFAGLYSEWVSADGSAIISFTICTTSPNKLMKNYHDRMPVILEEKNEKIWLNSKSELSTLNSILDPFDSSKMDVYEVSRLINSPANNSDEVIRPFSHDKQTTLF